MEEIELGVVNNSSVVAEYGVEVVIVGSGACGLCAAMAAKEAGAEVLVLERDSTSTGSTALSTGLIPAAGTRLQREKGIEDSAEIFFNDIVGKAKGKTDLHLAKVIAEASGATVDWLQDRHQIRFRLVEGFLYPGHSRLRMHGVPSRTGEELQNALLAAASRAEIDTINRASVEDIHVDGQGSVTAVGFRRPDGAMEVVGAGTLILACNGFGGAPELVDRYIPEMSKAEYWGHSGNKGDALKWGQALGAATADLGSYQGHGAVAYPHGRPMMWGLITGGGIQVNLGGKRFSNEASGYSEQAFEVIRQPESIAFNIYDERCEKPALDFTDYREVVELGGVKKSDTIVGLAAMLGLPADALERTIAEVDELRVTGRADEWGRNFSGTPPLLPPYCGARITGALFHTQGGLVVDESARVLRTNGQPFPNLFAGGGAARGLSGPSRWGYLSGNGLLTATVLGRLAGISAAQLVKGKAAA